MIQSAFAYYHRLINNSCFQSFRTTKMMNMGKANSKEYSITSELSLTLLRRWSFFRALGDKEILQITSFHVFYSKDYDCVGGPSAFFVTSAKQVYGYGHNCTAINILGFAVGSPGHLTEKATIPLAVDALCGREIRQVSVGGLVAAAVVDDGSLLWWGRCGKAGEMGTPQYPPNSRRKRFLRVGCGQRMMVGLTRSKKVYAWGQIVNGLSRFMEGERLHVNTAVVDISCGLHHCGLLGADGFVYGWGRGNEGQRGLPNYSTLDQNKPKKMTNETCVSVICSPYGTFVLTSRKEVRACGSNLDYHLGTGIGRRTTVLSRVPIMEAVKEVAVLRGPDDITRMAALTEDGFLYTWGMSVFPFPSTAQSFFEIFSSWEITPGLTSVSRPNPANGWAAGLITPRELRSIRAAPRDPKTVRSADILTYAYVSDRPELAADFPPSHVALVAKHITCSVSGKTFILDKFFTDIHFKKQILPE